VTESGRVTSVRISPSTATLITRQSTRLQAEVLDDDGIPLPGSPVLWFTSDATVAVAPDGNVTAVSPGSVTIGATSEGKTATAPVSVVLPRQSTITISPAADTIAGPPEHFSSGPKCAT
jgi:uncharacterized protein YjdB